MTLFPDLYLCSMTILHTAYEDRGGGSFVVVK